TPVSLAPATSAQRSGRREQATPRTQLRTYAIGWIIWSYELTKLSMRVLARFMIAASDVLHFPPPQLPEIAFLGRSNVGKSSVINSLVGSKIAKTSSTPGRTRSINFIEIRWPGRPRPELVFTDLPGYGYAKISREISAEWPKFVDPYL